MSEMFICQYRTLYENIINKSDGMAWRKEKVEILRTNKRAVLASGSRGPTGEMGAIDQLIKGTQIFAVYMSPKSIASLNATIPGSIQADYAALSISLIA